MEPKNVVLFILFIFGCIAFGIVWEIFRTKCPSCGKFFAREKLKEQSGVQGDRSFSQGYHTHKVTTTHCKCKFCGHEWTQTYKSAIKKK